MAKYIIPPVVRRLCKGFNLDLCPPVPPVPCPSSWPTIEVVKKPPISSTFNFYWLDWATWQDNKLGDIEGFCRTNMALQKAIGIDTVFIPYWPGTFYLDTLVRAAREYGLQVVLSTAKASHTGVEGWLEAVKKDAVAAMEYNPDGWYVDWELSMGGPYVPDISEFSQAINFIHNLKPGPILISPFYGPGGPFSPIDEDERDWEEFVRGVSVGLTPGVQMRSALQDGVGCDNTPDRIPGTGAYRELQKRFKLHKTICEKYGWKASINCELMGYSRSPATPERIKAQIIGATHPDFISEGLGIGPCFDSICLTYQTKAQGREYPSAVYKMLWDMYGG